MLNPVDFRGRPFHFIGIGGIGMSALAHVLVKRQLPVFGSDLAESRITQRLQADGAKVFIGQTAANFSHYSDTAPQVIASSAINESNAEYRAALELGCPIYHRSELLAALISQSRGIAVAGTHGKTTTSSMVGYVLMAAGLDPTIVVGGEVKAWEGNAHAGTGEYLVAEADESDGSLVKFHPEIGVITNVELDHPDHYASLEQVIDTFQTFASQCEVLVGCVDSPALKAAFQPDITYSLRADSQADYVADRIDYQGDGTTARILERGEVLGEIELAVLGEHNLSNALGAIAIGRHLGIGFTQIADALATFEGARRRFELRGQHHGITLIDDYAHHPSELEVTLAAARLRVGKSVSKPGRVVAIFQPHRYSRTLTFLDEFAKAFGNADVVITTDIYSAGEPDLGKITGQQLAEAIAQHHPHNLYQPTLQDVSAYLLETLTPGDLVLFLGAGNLNRIIPEVAAHFQQVEQRHVQTVCS
jgi:UDP-N-acetylmuramate--alanine ligase